LHNVCTISGVLHYSAAFVEVEYFNDRNAFADVLAIFAHMLFGYFSLVMYRNSAIRTFGSKFFVIIVLSSQQH